MFRLGCPTSISEINTILIMKIDRLCIGLCRVSWGNDMMTFRSPAKSGSVIKSPHVGMFQAKPSQLLRLKISGVRNFEAMPVQLKMGYVSHFQATPAD